MEKSSKSRKYDVALSNAVDVSDEDQRIRLSFIIHDAARLSRVVVDEVFRPLGVTRSQGWALAFLSRRDGLAQSDLAEDMDLGKVTLSGLIDRLEEAGVVQRRADPGDKRIKRIFITKEGRRVVKEMRRLTVELNERMLDGLTQKQVDGAVDFLRQVNRNLKSIKTDS